MENQIANLDQSQQLYREAIRSTSEYLQINPVFVEKDYWITKLLQKLAYNKFVDKAIFKGGTSLSKAYSLISRFSEDIDLAVVTTDLSGNQTKNVLSDVSRVMSEGLTEITIPNITSKGSRFRKSLFEYPALVDTNPLVSNRIIIEINSFANPFPFNKCEIHSFIYEFFKNNGFESYIEQFNLKPFSINVLDKRQTLCEKVVSLLRFSFADNVTESLSQKIRHFYDIYHLLLDKDCQEYVNVSFNSDFFVLVEHDRNIFTQPAQWNEKDLLTSPLFTDFDSVWAKLADTYSKELSALAYKPIPNADVIGKQCKELFEKIKEEKNERE